MIGNLIKSPEPIKSELNSLKARVNVLENRHLSADIILLDGNFWTAPSDGVLIISARAQYAGAYVYVKDIDLGRWISMTYLPTGDKYSSINVPVRKNKEYQINKSQVYEETFVFVHYN